jgi:hypothetical protein
VLQGADAGVPADAATLVRAPGYDGAVVAGTAVLFATDATQPAPGVSIDLPSDVGRILVTGLAPRGEYAVSRDGGHLSVAPGPGAKADVGGVLVVGP